MLDRPQVIQTPARLIAIRFTIPRPEIPRVIGPAGPVFSRRFPMDPDVNP